jgi:RNA-binding protein
MSLSTRQQSYLRGLGQALQPTLNIGREGHTEGTRQALEALFARHELVKGRVQKTSEGVPREVAAALAAETGAEVVGVVGRTFLLYRPNPDLKERIALPTGDARPKGGGGRRPSS